MTQGVTLVPEGRRIFPDMTVLENLKIGAYLRKDDLSADIEWVFGLFPRLKERSWQAGGTLSGGELQRFCIARALGASPRYLIADEISTMLDAVTQAQIWSFLLEECERQNMGLVFVSHSPALTKKIATRVVDLRECGRSYPANTRQSEVLPKPDGALRATRSPGTMDRLKPSYRVRLP